MATTRAKKEAVLTRVGEYIPNSKSIVFIDMKGLTVKDADDLRVQCDAAQIHCLVAKKTLFAKAFENAGITELTPRTLEGELAAAFSMTDEVAPARLFAKFGKEHDGFSMKAGLLMSEKAGSRYMDAAALTQLSLLPSKDELRAKLVGTIQRPISGMVTVLAGNLRGLVTVFKAMSEKGA